MKRHFLARGRAILAVVLAGVVLLLNAMAASPALHEWFHSDASQPEHQCAVTLFAHGQVASASVDVPILAAVSLVETICVETFSLYRPVIEHLPAGRAPPVLPVVS